MSGSPGSVPELIRLSFAGTNTVSRNAVTAVKREASSASPAMASAVDVSKSADGAAMASDPTIADPLLDPLASGAGAAGGNGSSVAASSAVPPSSASPPSIQRPWPSRGWLGSKPSFKSPSAIINRARNASLAANGGIIIAFATCDAGNETPEGVPFISAASLSKRPATPRPIQTYPTDVALTATEVISTHKDRGSKEPLVCIAASPFHASLAQNKNIVNAFYVFNGRVAEARSISP